MSRNTARRRVSVSQFFLWEIESTLAKIYHNTFFFFLSIVDDALRLFQRKEFVLVSRIHIISSVWKRTHTSLTETDKFHIYWKLFYLFILWRESSIEKFLKIDTRFYRLYWDLVSIFLRFFFNWLMDFCSFSVALLEIHLQSIINSDGISNWLEFNYRFRWNL